MKKFLLMLFICVTSFMIYTNNVKALDLELTINEVKVQEDQGSQYSLAVTNFIRYGILFRGYNSSTLDVQFAKKFSFYNSSFSTLDNSKTYNIDFLLFDSNQGYPLVYSSSRACTVSNAVSDIRKLVASGVTETISNTTDLYAVSCSMFSNTNPNIFIYHSSGLLTGGQGAYPVAISPYVKVYENVESQVSGINNNTEQIKNDIKSDNVSGAEGSADDLKNNSAFQDNTGLSGVISMPLTFVNSLTNTCQPIILNIPYMDVNVTIPCMQSVITDKMPLLANLIKIIVNGFIVYRILLDIFQIVRNAKNPEDDRIEVLDL